MVQHISQWNNYVPRVVMVRVVNGGGGGGEW